MPPSNKNFKRELWSQVNRGTPCPVCSRKRYCALSPNGDRVRCRFMAVGCYREEKDKNGETYYLHKVDGCQGIPPEPTPTTRCGTPELLVRVYTRLIDLLTLSNPHRE